MGMQAEPSRAPTPTSEEMRALGSTSDLSRCLRAQHRAAGGTARERGGADAMSPPRRRSTSPRAAAQATPTGSAVHARGRDLLTPVLDARLPNARPIVFSDSRGRRATTRTTRAEVAGARRPAFGPGDHGALAPRRAAARARVGQAADLGAEVPPATSRSPSLAHPRGRRRWRGRAARRPDRRGLVVAVRPARGDIALDAIRAVTNRGVSADERVMALRRDEKDTATRTARLPRLPMPNRSATKPQRRVQPWPPSRAPTSPSGPSTGAAAAASSTASSARRRRAAAADRDDGGGDRASAELAALARDRRRDRRHAAGTGEAAAG